jgi:hypothetical protein
MKRREFITLLGGAAVGWPLAARAQQGERVRRIGVLMGYAESDLEVQAHIAAFREGLQKHCLWGRISRQPMPRPLSLVGHVDRASKSRGTQPAERAAHRSRTRTARKYAVAQRSLLAPKCTPAAKRCRPHLVARGSIASCKGPGVRANDFGGGMQRARGRMSSDVRARAKPASARHLDRHGTGLGKAGARN